MYLRDAHIGRLRVPIREKLLDPISWRVRVEEFFSKVRWQPSGLNPAAILCIRSLRCGTDIVLRGAGEPQRFEEALTAILADMARCAARPALGAVPANAEAVLFLERAELLACLAGDWCDGTLVQRWWWHTLFDLTDVKRLVMNEWLEAPEYVPAALEKLPDGIAVRFVQRMDPVSARTLLFRVLQRFALPHLAARIECALRADADDGAEAGDVVGNQEPRHQQPLPVYRERGATPEQGYLLAVTRALVRTPALARSPRFAAMLTRQPHEPLIKLPATAATSNGGRRPVASGGRGRNRGGAARSVAGSHTGEAQTPKGEAQLPVASSEVSGCGRATSSSWMGSPVAASSATPGKADSTDYSAPSMSVGEAESRQHEAEAALPEPLDLRATSLDTPQSPVSEPDLPPPLLESSIETCCGGIFYLINAGLFLELYGDFTSPRDPGIPLPIWDFLSLVGGRLLGDFFREDPLRQLLSRLAMRGIDEEPEFLDAPGRWEVPPDWLKPFPEQAVWRWGAGEGRLRVKHPEGFLVLDLPLHEGDPVAQLANETVCYKPLARFELEEGAVGAKSQSVTSLDRWLGWLLPYLEARLRRALGLGDGDDLAALLLRQQAQVMVSPSHLDVHFALAEHPIEIRVAGLDRNPGWLPAAGRFIAFHYD